MGVIIAVILLTQTGLSAQRITRPSWPKKPGVYIARSSEKIPGFAGALSGYRPEKDKDYWGRPFTCRGTVRVFKSEDWKGIPNFPKSMNHCSDGVFMIRWRSGNPDVSTASAKGYSKDVLSSKPKNGGYGYMIGSNCEQPLFKFSGTKNGNPSTLVDVYYELKFWSAAP